MAFEFLKKLKRKEQLVNNSSQVTDSQSIERPVIPPVVPLSAEQSGSTVPTATVELPALQSEQSESPVPRELPPVAPEAAPKIPPETSVEPVVEQAPVARVEKDIPTQIKKSVSQIGTTASELPPSATPGQIKSATRQEIEDVLSAGLDEIYNRLTLEEQNKLRAVGEEIADRIEEMIIQFKATTKAVLDLIRRWLNLIPGVNKFFLEQESKLKTDEIIKLQEKYRRAEREKNIFRE